MMTLHELTKQALEDAMPSTDTAARIIHAQSTHFTVPCRRTMRPILTLLTLLLVLTLSVGAIAGIGAFARHFGQTPSGTTTPKILSQRCEGEFSVTYTEAWYADGKLYLAGELITPKPLDASSQYVLCPKITVNDVPVAGYESMKVYPDGANSIFIQPLTLNDMNVGDQLTLTIAVDAVEDWTTVGAVFNKADVTVYSGSCYAELEITAAPPVKVLQPDGTVIDRISFTAFTVLAEGSGLNDCMAALEMEDGSLLFGYVDENRLIFRFDEIGQTERAAVLMIADAFYTIPGELAVQTENCMRIPLK